eukprot:gene10828-22587_t
MSSSRMFVMDMYELQSDPCDNRVIRFNNCLQVLSCVCDILAIFEPQLRDLAQLIDLIARIVFYCTMGCMAAQVNFELDYRKVHCNTSGDVSEVHTPIVQAIPMKN